mgnify:CR=1 FL=1
MTETLTTFGVTPDTIARRFPHITFTASGDATPSSVTTEDLTEEIELCAATLCGILSSAGIDVSTYTLSTYPVGYRVAASFVALSTESVVRRVLFDDGTWERIEDRATVMLERFRTQISRLGEVAEDNEAGPRVVTSNTNRSTRLNSVNAITRKFHGDMKF